MAEPEEAEPIPEEPQKSGSKLWLIIVAGLLLLCAGGYGVKRVLGSGSGKKANAENIPLTVRVKSLMNLEPFLVNLADTDSTRFVKVTFRLGLDEPKLGEEYAGNQVILAATRDRIISLLSTKTAEELLSAEGKNQLREELRKTVNSILPKGQIVEVFILDIVVQL